MKPRGAGTKFKGAADTTAYLEEKSNVCKRLTFLFPFLLGTEHVSFAGTPERSI